MARSPVPSWQETFRAAGSGLLTALGSGTNRVVAVTGADHGDGRTTACAALATALGRTGLRVVAADLDLRRPDLHRRLGASNPAGAAEVLAGVKGLSECVQTVASGPDPAAGEERAVLLLPAGNPPADPAELLTVAALTSLFDALSADADLVLVDTPPLLPFADGRLIGARAAGAVVVVRERRTRTEALDQVGNALRLSGIRPLGLLYNRERR